MVKILLKNLVSYQKEKELQKFFAAKPRGRIDLSSINRVLCIQMNAIGDVLMTQPAWTTLKSHLPGAEIDLLCRPHIARLFRNDLALKTIITAENRKFKNWLFKNRSGLDKILATNNYDLIVDFSALPLTAIFCADQTVSPSIGFQREVDGNSRKIELSNAYDLSFPYLEDIPIRDLMLRLVSPWDHHGQSKKVPTLNLAEGSMSRADNLLHERDLAAKKFIVMHPGSKWPPKRWPLSLWGDLVKRINPKQHLPVLFLGARDDKDLIRDIQKTTGCSTVHFMISNELDISAAIIKRALLCVCNDSAAMHISAAVGTPSVSLFGPVTPERSAPPPDTGCTVLYNNTFCSPCTLYYSRNRCRRGLNFCMYGITPSAVLEAIESTLQPAQ
jgi:ADP-heptose:LPS heptosyltransferase